MSMAKTETLTEAFASGQIQLTFGARNGSTVRAIPYDEIYRESTIQRETPAERVQRISMEDAEPKKEETPASD
jgi:hypothetical protein